MNKESSLTSSSSAVGLIPVRDYTRALIQSQCPSCKKPMPAFQRHRLSQEKILVCICGYRRCVCEEEYERLTSRCGVCGKKGCTGYDHRFHRELIGMGF